MTTDVINGVPREWLKQLHQLIWANLRGCDPAYCEDAQARLAEIDTMLAAAQPAADELLHCDFCQAETADPWHGSGVFDGVERRHVHACDACRPKLQNTQPAEDGERESHWFSLVMNAAAELETASYSIQDAEAKRIAQSGADHYRAKANETWQARAAQPQQAVAVTDEVRRDAERYRWLRNSGRLIGEFADSHEHNICVSTADGEDVLWFEQLDAAIDAALSAPSHGEQVREAVLEELLTRCADWCDKQQKQPWYGRTAGDMVRTFMVCQPLSAAPSAGIQENGE